MSGAKQQQRVGQLLAVRYRKLFEGVSDKDINNVVLVHTSNYQRTLFSAWSLLEGDQSLSVHRLSLAGVLSPQILSLDHLQSTDSLSRASSAHRFCLSSTLSPQILSRGRPQPTDSVSRAPSVHSVTSAFSPQILSLLSQQCYQCLQSTDSVSRAPVAHRFTSVISPQILSLEHPQSTDSVFFSVHRFTSAFSPQIHFTDGTLMIGQVCSRIFLASSTISRTGKKWTRLY